MLDYLRTHHDATAADLARALRLTHADVRYHLNLLLDEGALIVTDWRVKGRGRPARCYRSATAAPKTSFDLLASSLLTESLSGLPATDQDALLRRIAARLALQPWPIRQAKFPRGDRPPIIATSSSLSSRLVHAVACLNDLGYQARWEAHADSPRLILEHCPFAALHDDHPALLRLDELLIETLLAAPVMRLATSEHGHPHNVHGVFAVRSR
jgi:predicted ArsR family transcriptional regulator